MKRPAPRGKGGLQQADDRISADIAPACPRPLLTQVLDGCTLCELVVWTDEQWSELSATERPERACYFPGLGWVCAVPTVSMN